MSVSFGMHQQCLPSGAGRLVAENAMGKLRRWLAAMTRGLRVDSPGRVPTMRSTFARVFRGTHTPRRTFVILILVVYL